jgi:putative transposase
VIELRPQFPLASLLLAAGLARSTFYYQQAALQVVDSYAATKSQIKAIYDLHKGRYGYRRITATLRRQGNVINHKTVQRLMEELQLKSLVRLKKYRSYRGQVGQVAPNLLERDFDASTPNEKWVTDVTCSVPCDHVPVRSWPLFRAREVMPVLIKALKQELSA